MLRRWSAGAFVAALLALAAMPATGQVPLPACPAAALAPPERIEFEALRGSSDAITSAAATHAVQLFIYMPNSGLKSLVDPAIQLTPPPGLEVTRRHGSDPEAVYWDFTPTAAGTLTFGISWTQLTTDLGAQQCTGTTSVTFTVTKPSPVKVSKILGYHLANRPDRAGAANEFVLQARVIGDAKNGDLSPIHIAVRAINGSHLPRAGSPVTALTLDPRNIPRDGVRVKSKLVRVHAGYFGDARAVYEFEVGVQARPPNGKGRAHRGVEIVLSTGARRLATFHYVTQCDSAFGGLQCVPLPKGSPTP
jgi:hypothetical protein